MRLAKWRPITATDCHICLPPLLPGNKTFRLLAWCHDPLLSPSWHPFPLPTAITFAAFVICLQLPLILEAPNCSSCDRVCWQLPNLADDPGSCVCVSVCECHSLGHALRHEQFTLSHGLRAERVQQIKNKLVRTEFRSTL